MTPIRLGLYAEVDVNLVDGSSVWLQSLALVLARIPGTSLQVVLRTSPTRDVITAPMVAHPAIELVDEAQRLGVPRLSADAAHDALARLDAIAPFDAVVVRGPATADALAGDPRFDGRLWLYHVPVADDESAGRAALEARIAAAALILCQTEAVRSRVAALVPGAAGRCVLLPPMIPEPRARSRTFDPERPRLVYAGKFSPGYCFFETLDAFRRVREEIPGAELHLAGDKVHNPPTDPSFRQRVLDALANEPGVRSHGPLTREHVAEMLAGCDIALSLRLPELDASDELSTKVLEYGSAGCAVVLNRNPRHVELLGADYPLFAEPATAPDVLARACADPALVARAAEVCRTASTAYTFDAAAERLTPLVRGLGGAERPGHAGTLLIAGHDLKFTGSIRELGGSSGWRVVEDVWRKHDDHDEALSLASLESASTILCEWCMGNAAWYAEHRRPDQRLVIRFHRSELTTPYPGRVDPARADAVVFVADWVRAAAVEKFGWDPDAASLEVIENVVDATPLRRPKLDGAEFTIAFVGFVPQLKRLDRALDLLERVRLHDRRFRLLVKGHPPWSYEWMLGNSDELAYYETCFERIRNAPLLGDAVTFEEHGDIADFFQKAGWVASLSDVEGHAVALAEGMASGSVPIVVDRPGARDQYPREWVHQSPADAARWLLEVVASGLVREQMAAAAAYSRRWSPDVVLPRWRELLFDS